MKIGTLKTLIIYYIKVSFLSLECQNELPICYGFGFCWVGKKALLKYRKLYFHLYKEKTIKNSTLTLLSFEFTPQIFFCCWNWINNSQIYKLENREQVFQKNSTLRLFPSHFYSGFNKKPIKNSNWNFKAKIQCLFGLAAQQICPIPFWELN